MEQMQSLLLNTEPFTARFGSEYWDRMTPSWCIPTLAQIHTSTVGAVSDFVKLLHDPGFAVPMGIGTAAFVALLSYVAFTRKGRKGKKMGKRSRHLETLIADIIVDAVEDLRYRDKITKKEKFRLYRRLAKALDIPDLAPYHPAKVKHDVKHRLGNGVYKTKPNIPGEQPLTMEEISDKRVKPRQRRVSGILAVKSA